MKAASALTAFLTCPPGRHRAFNEWHDTDHRPENHGQIDHIYHSVRYVAEREQLAARQVLEGGLAGPGGEYLAMYWSTASPEQLLYDMTVVRERLRLLGRCEPINRDFRAVWRDRVHVVRAYVPPGSILSADAVPLAPHDGVVATLGQYPPELAAWARRHDDEFVPRLLAGGDVAGIFTFMPMKEQDHHLFVHLWFTTGDPLAVQTRATEIEADLGDPAATDPSPVLLRPGDTRALRRPHLKTPVRPPDCQASREARQARVRSTSSGVPVGAAAMLVAPASK